MIKKCLKCRTPVVWGSRFCAAHLSELGSEIVGEWQAKVVKHKLELNGADFTSAPLERIKLVEADLSGANLRGAKLSGADLTWTKLKGADLSGADLRGAALGGADLQDSRLTAANLSEADLEGARMNRADLENAKLDSAKLFRAQFREARCRAAEFFRVDAVGADFYYANLQNADLRYAKLKSVDFRGAVLWGADLSNSSTAQANFNGIKFTRYKPLPESVQGLAVKIWMTFNKRKSEEFKGKSLDQICQMTNQDIDDPDKLYCSLICGMAAPTRWKGSVSETIQAEPKTFHFIKKMSSLESRLEKSKANPFERVVMFIWGVTSGYGTQPGLLAFWMGLLIIALIACSSLFTK